MQIVRRVPALGGIALIAAACGTEPASPFRRIDGTADASTTAPGKPVEEHAVRGAALRDAVESGNLERTKQTALALADLVTAHERPVPDSALDHMVVATRRVAAAPDQRDAARAFAVLAQRCGECHVRIGGPSSRPASAPAASLALVPRMRRHQWGAARLWEGLVAPSDEAWTSGARVLADAPLGPEGWPEGTTSPEIEVLSTTVHDLGVRAAAATKASTRIALYGEVLATCATCHERVRGGPR